jgi:hypothetical protein
MSSMVNRFTPYPGWLVLIGVTIPRCARSSAYATSGAQANDSIRSRSKVRQALRLYAKGCRAGPFVQAARLPSAATTTNDRPSLAVLTDGRHLIVLGLVCAAHLNASGSRHPIQTFSFVSDVSANTRQKLLRSTQATPSWLRDEENWNRCGITPSARISGYGTCACRRRTAGYRPCP